MHTLLSILKRLFRSPSREDHELKIKKQVSMFRKFEERVCSTLNNKSFKNSNVQKYILRQSEELKNYKNILDFGSGTGDDSFYLSNIDSIRKIYLYDPIYKEKRYRKTIEKIPFKKKKINIIDDFNLIIEKVDLVFSNNVFNHLDDKQLQEILNIFRNNKCDILLSSNVEDTLQSTKKKSLSKFIKNSGLYRRNYLYFLKEAGYKIIWAYNIKDNLSSNKNIFICYVKASL